MSPRREHQEGLTFIELLVSIVILSILASVILPLSRMSERRAQEIELRQDLRRMREAIDRFKRDWDLRRISRLESDVANPETGYPESLEILVEGAPSGDAQGTIRKYLRRIPTDPIHGGKEWGLRCYEDEPDSSVWCGKDVFDVYSMSDRLSLEGTAYAEW